ncbi:MAG: class F sortase [Nocardioidaceae bacterium]|nr:class F sortase [Nocardioidaceae bacterium]MCL2613983.1 class F sortase [Nocardioidaceae bacterium]
MQGQRIEHRDHDGAGWRVILLVLTLLTAGLSLTPASPALAAPCADAQNNPVSVGGFEIDGNLCQNAAGALDWDTATGGPIVSDPQGSADGSAFSGASENGWPWSVSQTSGSNPAGNADITHVFGYSQISGSHVFAYFGWERVATQGTTGFYVELNQKPNLRGPVPDRTDGDLRLRFIQQGNTLLTLDEAYLWSSTGPTSGSWVPIPVAGYQARVNAVPVSNLPGLSPSPMPAGTFAEAAVDISGLFSGAGVCGGQLGYMNLRSVSSLQATNPPLQDWVEPVRLGVPSTCPTVVLRKHWVNGAAGDTADLSLDHATTAPGSATSTAGGQPDLVDTAHQASEEVEPGSTVALGETLGAANTGTYDSALACDAGAVTSAPDGRSGSVQVPATAGAGDVVTCTATNTRTSAQLSLTKVWATATAGDTMGLRIETDQGSTGPTTSTAPTSTTVSSTVFSGEPVTVVETPGAANAASYHATTVCTGVDGFTASDMGGSFTVPANPGPMSCTITNSAVPAELTLIKSWVRGAHGDTADLTIDDAGNTDGATAVVPAGGSGVSAEAASLPILPGDTVSLSEALPAAGRTNAGIYRPASLTCNGDPVQFSSTSAGATSSSATASYRVPSSAPVVCVITNDPLYRVLLSKVWGANAVAGDTADLTVSNSTSGDTGSQTAVAPAPPPAPAAVIAAGGDTIHLSESVSGGGAYTSQLSCDHGARTAPGGASGTTGTLVVPGNLTAGAAVLCTFTNTARYAVTLTKDWSADSVAGDTAALTVRNATTGEVSGAVTATAPDPPPTRPAVSASASDVIDVRETLGVGDSGSYRPSLECTAGPFSTPASTTGGEFAVPDDLPAGTTIACTITNRRVMSVASPHVRTTVSLHRVAPGGAFRDRVHVRGLYAGQRASAVAALYGPYSARTSASCRPSKRVRAFTLRVGNGWTRTGLVRLREPGVYTWRVIVAAGAANHGASHPCGQASESTVVARRPYRAPLVDGGFSGTVQRRSSYRREPVTVRMPAIGLAAPVLPAGVARGVMRLPDDVHAVGWLRTSAAVGDHIGVMVIGGHVSDRHDRPGALFHLDRARVGQVIKVVQGGVRHVYRVTSRRTFRRGVPLPGRYVSTTGRPRLVLASCTDEIVYANGHFHYRRLLVVEARELYSAG